MQGGTKITPEVVQSVRDAIDIVEVAGEMTRLVKKGGSKYEGLCPFHKEKTPSFSVDSDKGLFYCFGCGAGGDAIKLYMQHHGDDFPAAIEALASRYGIALSMAPPSAAQLRQRQLGTALEAASEFFRHRLLQAGEARRYLQRRQISSELQERFALGYAPEGWHFLLDALGARFPVEDLEEAGLVGISRKDPSRPRPYDRFRHRLMFPIHNPTGRLVGFGGRTLGDDKAKYINTSETEQFKKGHFLYGFHLAKRAMRDAGKVLLVEGYFDVLGAAACGIDWVVAGMGTALTADQARLMARYTDEVVLAYDGDAAGQKAVQRSLPILLAAGLGVRRARFPAGHDPDSLRLEQGADEVLDIVRGATDAVQEEIERLTPLEIQKDPREKTRAASAIAEILKPIRDSIIKHSYGQMAAERLGVPVEMLWRRVGGSSKPSPSPEPQGAFTQRLGALDGRESHPAIADGRCTSARPLRLAVPRGLLG